ncbi:putative tricarboxylic transport membrane protein [Knoellia remsis]|uniref:Putative tricarboxylic transport membrane protein n=1 Tax=Knoellia remsis TaxID=407159 RepID=A0A2T0UGP5_9MICO|nr:tripartite tricarboxylate transporter TctB family protein [Knoellia remsis]PRY57120.1 putative tricarboxylic transport membrane protein [Knoellia remsis]
MSDATTRSPQRVRDRAQLGLCAALAGLGVLILVDASRIGQATSSNDPLGPRAVPLFLGVALLLVSGLYLLDVLRGGRGEEEEGEDVDLDSRADWRTLGLLAFFFLLNAVTIDRLGWVISGSILFWGSAFALGNRHHIRGLVIGVALALVTFYGFAIGLGVNLPAGILQGIL